MPHWLALYVSDRTTSHEQASALVGALSKKGIEAKAIPIKDTDHSRMTREMGTEEGSAQTKAVNAFLEELFPEALQP